MRKKNIYLADILGILLLIGLIFAPFINLSYSKYLEKSVFVYFMAYLSFLFLKMPKGRALFFILPLLINTVIIFYFFKEASFFNNKEVYRDILTLVRDTFPLISLGLVFFLIERFSTKVFGSYFTIFLGVLSLFAYILMEFTGVLSDFKAYKPYFFYLFVFLIFASLNYKRKFRPIFYFLSILLIGLEVFLYYKKDMYLGFFLTPILLLYLIFTKEGQRSKANFEKYFLFALIFTFPLVKYAMAYFLHIRPLALSLASLIISFFISVILYEAKLKIFSNIFLGLV